VTIARRCDRFRGYRSGEGRLPQAPASHAAIDGSRARTAPGWCEIREREPQARESFPGRAPRVSSVDPTAEAAVRYDALSVRERRHASEAKLNAVKAAGYNYAQLIEIVRHVALNTWTNAINAAFKREWTSWSARRDKAGLKPLKDHLQNQLARFRSF
jgi:hypothetical protein